MGNRGRDGEEMERTQKEEIYIYIYRERERKKTCPIFWASLRVSSSANHFNSLKFRCFCSKNIEAFAFAMFAMMFQVWFG